MGVCAHDEKVIMKEIKFTCFYPSRRFWAGSKVDFSAQKIDDCFYKQMSEEVFSEEHDTHTVKVCRDGMVMVRIESLEAGGSHRANLSVGDVVKRWSAYLDYLNSFYLLLDSSVFELSSISYFDFHEITKRDAFRMRCNDEKYASEHPGCDSLALDFIMGRSLTSYSSEDSLEFHHKIMLREVIPIGTIQHAYKKFMKVMDVPGLQKKLSSFAKSLGEYKVGNYETSIVLAWFVTEEILNDLWVGHIDGLDKKFDGDKRRVSRDRKNFLMGREFTVSVVSNLLELWDVLTFEQLKDLDKVRKCRNAIAHSGNKNPDAEAARLALSVANSMIARIGNVHFKPNLDCSVQRF